ncbi:hypothetical protein BSKO_05285 [Bryopsis sp. KO-2023]|nr:hypothetical protein BSKO_05285 [Bryopsis sp. KO-2023]
MMIFQAVVGCLSVLLEESENWPRLLENDGLIPLIDLLGPPPAFIKEREKDRLNAYLERQKAENDNKTGKQEREDSDRAKNPKGLRVVVPGQGGQDTSENAPTVQEPHVEEDLSSFVSCTSLNTAWKAILSLQPKACAAKCLYRLAQSERCCELMDERYATHRLVAILQGIMAESAGDGGKKGKKGKKKGLKLEPEQEDAVTSVTGCLKFLATSNPNRYRIAQLGAVPVLQNLHENADRLMLRRNAQILLTSVAMLSENSEILKKCGLGEEFAVPVPMTLTRDERLQAHEEFGSFPTVTKEAADGVSKEGVESTSLEQKT